MARRRFRLTVGTRVGTPDGALHVARPENLPGRALGTCIALPMEGLHRIEVDDERPPALCHVCWASAIGHPALPLTDDELDDQIVWMLRGPGHDEILAAKRLRRRPFVSGD